MAHLRGACKACVVVVPTAGPGPQIQQHHLERGTYLTTSQPEVVEIEAPNRTTSLGPHRIPIQAIPASAAIFRFDEPPRRRQHFPVSCSWHSVSTYSPTPLPINPHQPCHCLPVDAHGALLPTGHLGMGGSNGANDPVRPRSEIESKETSHLSPSQLRVPQA